MTREEKIKLVIKTIGPEKVSKHVNFDGCTDADFESFFHVWYKATEVHLEDWTHLFGDAGILRKDNKNSSDRE